MGVQYGAHETAWRSGRAPNGWVTSPRFFCLHAAMLPCHHRPIPASLSATALARPHTLINRENRETPGSEPHSGPLKLFYGDPTSSPTPSTTSVKPRFVSLCSSARLPVPSSLVTIHHTISPTPQSTSKSTGGSTHPHLPGCPDLGNVYPCSIWVTSQLHRCLKLAQKPLTCHGYRISPFQQVSYL
ncbi:hypothetical protein N657DRAFT_294461 [Parathielavia appendiculata]|uniref:Uncharacterized protein n=1 Tax=Parathielavia appendiculata TaxID=2587402 RepID=A0AAN6U4S3_9PEZI|nr:hypothetical protein N657DRAFT_294461 [Parathielavia appendiculata]